MRGQRHLTAESAAVCLAGATVRLAWALALVRSLLGAAWVMPAGHRYPLWLAIVALVGAWALARLARHPRMATRLPGLMPLAVALGVALTVLSLTLQSDIDVRGIVLWARRVISGSAAPLVGVPAQAIVGVTTALLWREGLRVDWRDSEALWRSFQRGILALSGLALAHNADSGALPAHVPVGMLILVASGLIGLALLAATERRGLAAARRGPPQGLWRSWLLVTGGVVGAILVIGWTLGGVLSPNAISQLVALTRPALRLLGSLVQLILLGLAYVLFWLLTPILEALLASAGERELEMEGLRSGLGEDLLEQAQETWNMPPLLRALLLGLGLATILVVLGVAFWRAWRRTRDASDQLAVDERRESLWSADLLRQQLASLFRPGRPPAPLFLPLPNSEDPRAAVRRVYQQLLAAAAEGGHVRQPGWTPARFSQALSTLLPSQRASIETLTALYVEARYGEGPIPPEAASAAEEAWQALAPELLRLESEAPLAGR